jgi:hypothetical protein
MDKKQVHRVGKVLLCLLMLIGNSWLQDAFTQDASWTIMVYLDGDNDLEEPTLKIFNEMESVGSTEAVNMVVQFDRVNGYSTSDGDWSDTRRFRVLYDSYPDSITSPVIEVLGELNMGNPQTLTDFITWAATEYPAEHYALIIVDHGMGWMKFDKPDVTNSTTEKGVCLDVTNNDTLSIPEVSSAIRASSIFFDIISYDACLMAMVEVAYQIKDLAGIMIASEDIGYGLDYSAFLNILKNHPEMSATQLAGYIVDTYGDFFGDNITQSATDLSRMKNIITELDSLVQAILNIDNLWDTVAWIREASLRFAGPDNNYYYDLGDFASGIVQTIQNQVVLKAAIDLADTIESVVFYHYVCLGIPDATGLTIYFPPRAQYSSDYEEENAGRDFADSTKWVDFLHAYYSHIDPIGLNPEQSINRINIYPNPASNQVNIDFQNGINEKTRIELMDVSGKIVFAEFLQAGSPVTHTINLSSAEEGIYLIQISNAEYNVSEKIIKVE